MRLSTTYMMVWLVSLGLTSCTGKTKTKSLLRIAYSLNRQAMLEPCGCSMAPIGGVLREANLLQTIDDKNNTFSLTGGHTFISPETDHITDRHKKRAPLLIQALTALGTHALSPSLSDLRLGVGFLRTLSTKAPFPFVTTNIYYQGKPLFHPVVSMKLDRYNIRIFGLAARNIAPLPSGITLVSEKQALAPYFSGLNARGTLNILIAANFHSAKLESLLESYPDLHIVLRGEGTEGKTLQYLFDENTLWAEGKSKGRYLGLISLQVNPTFRHFYNPQFASYTNSNRKVWQKELRKPTSLNPLRRSRIEKLLFRTKNIPMSMGSHTSRFEFQNYLLDRKYDRSNTRIQRVLDLWKKQ